ncbi:MAG: ABC transporter ATP-binding protein [Puniceicoccales bacterium]|jgi:lipoprotein-releasing system ATP-binding protein|nr:ABC transporter ATP-binding protein [Puniceicoccales bacterium]
MSVSPIIALENVSKQFRSPDGQINTILQNISFSITTNQTCSITGESGSGKSTLLNIIGGLDYPSSGSVFWKEKYIHTFSTDQLAFLRQSFLGFIFQSSNLIPELTVLENILFPVRIAGKNIQPYRSQAMELLQQLNIANQAQQIPEKLSGGERQRVAIARALILCPELIIADEPTGNLDEKNAAVVIDFLLKLCNEYHSSLLLVTHNTIFAEKMQRSFTVKSGELIRLNMGLRPIPRKESWTP